VRNFQILIVLQSKSVSNVYKVQISFPRPFIRTLPKPPGTPGLLSYSPQMKIPGGATVWLL